MDGRAAGRRSIPPKRFVADENATRLSKCAHTRVLQSGHALKGHPPYRPQGRWHAWSMHACMRMLTKVVVVHVAVLHHGRRAAARGPNGWHTARAGRNRRPHMWRPLRAHKGCGGRRASAVHRHRVIVSVHRQLLRRTQYSVEHRARALVSRTLAMKRGRKRDHAARMHAWHHAVGLPCAGVLVTCPQRGRPSPPSSAAPCSRNAGAASALHSPPTRRRRPARCSAARSFSSGLWRYQPGTQLQLLGSGLRVTRRNAPPAPGIMAAALLCYSKRAQRLPPPLPIYRPLFFFHVDPAWMDCAAVLRYAALTRSPWDQRSEGWGA